MPIRVDEYLRPIAAIQFPLTPAAGLKVQRSFAHTRPLIVQLQTKATAASMNEFVCQRSMLMTALPNRSLFAPDDGSELPDPCALRSIETLRASFPDQERSKGFL